MAIIKTIDALKKYVSVNRLEYDNVLPYVKKAERTYLKPVVGAALLKTISKEHGENEPQKEVYDLLQEAVANIAFFVYLPLAQVAITDHGISTSQGEDYKPAEWWQIRDLRRSFLDIGFTALDEALEVMESHAADFPEWKKSQAYTLHNETLVKRAKTFNRWYNIDNSRITFLALRPYLLETHHHYFISKLGAATLAQVNQAIRPDTTVPEPLGDKDVPVLNALEMLQAAQVNYTIAKALGSGMFEVSSGGIHKLISELPGYKAKPYPPDVVTKMERERLTVAEEYFKKALKIIKENLDVFQDYKAKLNANVIRPKNTKSTVGF